MNPTVVAAIVGAIAGIITGSISSIIAPWANWGIEKRKQKLAYRKELIVKWRAMIENISQGQLESFKPLIHILELQSDYYSLKPHLRPQTLEAIGGVDTEEGRLAVLRQEIDMKSWRPDKPKLLDDPYELLIPQDILCSHSSYKRPVNTTAAFRYLVDEVGRLEKIWGLV